MKFIISSRADVLKKVAKLLPEHPVIISILDTDKDSPNHKPLDPIFDIEGGELPILSLTFDDTDDGKYGQLMTDDNAEDIAMFYSRFIYCKVILIHCTGGISRSAAVAAALSKFCYDTDFWVFGATNLYRPNMFVYRKVLSALRELLN